MSIAVHNDVRPGQCKGIVAYGYNTQDGRFVSKVNFTAESRYNGRTLLCRIDNGPGHSQTLVENITVNITQGISMK